MAKTPPKLYVNPLTIDAVHFLQSINIANAGENYQIDIELCMVLENIVKAIGAYLTGKPKSIFTDGKLKVLPLPEVGTIGKVYSCQPCKRLPLCNTSVEAATHLAQNHPKFETQRKSAKQKRKDERKRLEEAGSVSLTKKAKALISSNLPKMMEESIIIAEKLKEIPEYEFIENELLDVIRPLYPDKNIKIFKFGSRISGIGTRNSDLDLFVEIGNTFHTFENRGSVQTQEYVKTVHTALIKQSIKWKLLVLVDKARVPIIKVLNTATKIQCDIGFSNSLGFCNTQLMSYLFELQPLARGMCIFMKRWMQRTKTDDILGSYNMAMLVVYYLQTTKQLPPIASLQENIKSPVYVGPWLSNFVSKPYAELTLQPVSISWQDLFTNLRGFFAHYATFDFTNYIVCPYLGKKVKITNFAKEMPKRYTKYIATDKECALEIRPMMVQDPLQLNHNLTKAVTPRLLQAYRQYFALSANAFAECVY